MSKENAKNVSTLSTVYHTHHSIFILFFIKNKRITHKNKRCSRELWKMLDELLTEVVAVDVRVDFCGGDVFVSQHLLYGA